MNKLTRYAKAKINLTLDVLGKREDGYHDLRMIMAEIPLADTVTLIKQDEITVRTNLSFLPKNDKNIAFRAAKLFFEETGISGGVAITIDKKIPVSAGLAGGSTDAAAVFHGLNELYETNLSLAQLQHMGNKIGKDIPFCLQGGVALAEGTGERLTTLPELSHCFIVLIKPKHINVSTKDVFTSLQASKIELHPDTAGAIQSLEQEDIHGLSRRMYNVLEEVTVKKHPLIAELKSVMMEEGALGSVMSGSGPSVFGIFDSLQSAENARQRLLNYDEQVFLMTV